MYTEATRFALITVLVSLTTPVTALEMPGWLQPVLPVKGNTPAAEIKCYSLPYGGIGFVSHALTYWALFWLWKGRRPYWPWRRLSYGKTDIALSILQITATVAIAAFTIARCKNRWQFITIAVWKLFLSLEVGIWGFRASMWARKNGKEGADVEVSKTQSLEDEEVIGQAMQWFLLTVYAVVTMIALGGLVSLIIPNWHYPDIVTITTVFAVAAGAALFLSFFFWLVFQADIAHRYSGLGESDERTRLTKMNGSRDLSLTTIFTFGLFVGLVSVLMFLFALYCDWVLAFLAANYTGVPSGDNAALYWTYFAAKRLPLLFT